MEMGKISAQAWSLTITFKSTCAEWWVVVENMIKWSSWILNLKVILWVSECLCFDCGIFVHQSLSQCALFKTDLDLSRQRKLRETIFLQCLSDGGLLVRVSIGETEWWRASSWGLQPTQTGNLSRGLPVCKVSELKCTTVWNTDLKICIMSKFAYLGSFWHPLH